MQLPVNFSDEEVKERKFYKQIFKTSVQISANTIVLELIWNINLVFLGTLNRPDIIAAVGLSDMIIYFSGCLFVIGLNEGYSSLAGRSYTAGHYRLMGIYLNKAFFLLLIFFAVPCIVAMFADKILIALWQEPEIAEIAQEYLTCLLPLIFFEYIFDLLRSYLNCMEIYHVHSIINVVTTVLHPIFCIYFIQYGFKGIALASTITQGLNLISISLYIFINNPCPESWFFDFSTVFSGLWKYIKYVFPIAVPICFDALFYGAKTLIVGTFHNPVMLAAHVIVTNIFEIFYCIFLGINVSLNTLSANAVGQRHIKKCRLLTKFAYIFGFIIGGIFMIIFLFFARYVFILFTREEDVLEYMIYISKIIAAFVTFDYVQSGLQGIVKGVGLGDYGLYATVISYWVIGLPVCAILAIYYDLQLLGVWIGYGVAAILLFLINSFIIYKIHWPSLILEAYDELQEENKLMEKEEEEFQIEFVEEGEDKYAVNNNSISKNI